jgi:hypothetical protein
MLLLLLLKLSIVAARFVTATGTAAAGGKASRLACLMLLWSTV